MRCTCGNENSKGSRFCSKCGSKLCPECAHPITSDSRFCSYCGHNMTNVQSVAPTMNDSVIAGDVDQSVHMSYVTNVYNPTGADKTVDLECCICHTFIPRSRSQESRCSGCGRLFCDKHMENRMCSDCRNELPLAPYLYEKLAGGKFLIKGVKERLPSFVTIPKNVEIIDAQAFMSMDFIEVTLPEGLVRIGERAFANCPYLEKINFPASLKRIEAEAFLNCACLEVLPPLHVRTDETAFNGTDYQVRLEAKRQAEERKAEETRKAEEARLAEMARRAEEARQTKESRTDAIPCQFEFEIQIEGDRTVSILSKVVNLNDGKVIIPPNDPQGNPITCIGKYAFDNCTGLTSVVIPQGVTKIGSSAFGGCTRLTSVTIPDSVTEIEYCAFVNCSSLVSVTIPDSVTDIGSGAFGGCTSLKSVSLSHNIDSINQKTFYGCVSLTSILIPDNVKWINAQAFAGCKQLRGVSLPHHVSAAASAFTGTPYHKAEKKRQATQDDQLQRSRRLRGVCPYCGGSFEGLIIMTCQDCGRKKDY